MISCFGFILDSAASLSLMALFNLVSVAILESPTSKLSKFQAFVLTLMKLRLDVSNYDLGFRFGISVSAVS